jgi:glycosyltransferase involved in cell wall biosynthesis
VNDAEVLAGRRLVHVTTTDISLVLLLGPQLRAFAAAGMEVIGVSAPGAWAGQLPNWGARHEPLHHATRSADLLEDSLALGELTRLLRRIRPDVVHTHNPKPGLYGRLAARLARVPVVVNTVHGLYATADDPLAKRMLVYGAERAASMCSAAELVQNVEDLEVLRRLRVPSRKLVLLGNGVDLERFHPRRREGAVAEARQSLRLEKDKIVVGTVARLVWQKGFRELLAAAASLRQRRPDVVFCIVGPEDPEKGDALGAEDMKRALELGNVTFAGLRHDMESIYPAFDLFALPSYREGFSRTAMEAAACGVPVIASDIRGCRQVVDNGVTGLLVPVRDPQALAAAIEELADDAPRRRAMGKAAAAKAESEFDDRRVAGTTLDVYRRLLERRAHRPPRRNVPR